MRNFDFPKSVRIELSKLDEEWLKNNPLFVSIRSFAKNKITDDQMWGGVDHRLDLLLLEKKSTLFSGDFLKQYDDERRDLSSMEIRPISFHYSLIEIELMSTESLNSWMKYLEQAENYFAHEETLGKTDFLKKRILESGNSSIQYRDYFHRIRDVWDSKEDEKEYHFAFERKK